MGMCYIACSRGNIEFIQNTRSSVKIEALFPYTEAYTHEFRSPEVLDDPVGRLSVGLWNRIKFFGGLFYLLKVKLPSSSL